MLHKFAKFLYKRIYFIKQLFVDIKFHAKFKNTNFPNIYRRVFEQTILLLRRGITSRRYYLYGLYRTDIKWHKKMEFIGDYFTWHWQGAINPQKYKIITNDKVIFNIYMKSNNLRVNKIIATIGKDGCSESGMPLVTDIQIKDWLNNELYENVFLKPRSGEGAVGLLSLGNRTQEGNSWIALPKREKIDVEGIVEHFHRFPEYSFIMEPRLKPHLDLQVFEKDVLHTARIITLFDSEVEIISAALKIGTGIYAGDNLIQGNVVAPIDINSGIIGKGVSIKNGFAQTLEIHPVTKEKIDGFKIPDWGLALELVKEAAIHLNFFKMLGWDIGFTDQGPVIIEANENFDPILNQISSGRGLLSNTQFKEFFDNNKLFKKIRIL